MSAGPLCDTLNFFLDAMQTVINLGFTVLSFFGFQPIDLRALLSANSIFGCNI